MQLTYRGVSFETFISGSPSIATEETGTFLGKRYPIKQSQVVYRQPSSELVYRGVAYTR